MKRLALFRAQGEWAGMLRERGKQSRRDSILRAAELLIRKTGSIDFSLNELSVEASVSVGTIYNLIGPKNTVLYALLYWSLEEIDLNVGIRRDGVSVVKQALSASDMAASFFQNDPVFLRPLYRYLLGVSEPEYRQAFVDRTLEFWKSKLAILDSAGLLTPEITLDDIAREHQIYFAGLLDHWVQGDVANNEITMHARYSGALRLLGIASDEDRTWLLGEMSAVKARLGNGTKRKVQSSLD